MEHGLERRRSRIQVQTSDAVKVYTVKEYTPLPLTEKSAQFQGKHKVQHPFGQPYLDPNGELRQNAINQHLILYKSSENSQKSMLGRKACNDDELVRHMSNLPGFLQPVEKKKNIQEKALNFGVLDWKSLEKWKYNERMPAKCHRKTASHSSSSYFMASGPPKISPNLKKQPSSHDLYPSSSSHGNPSIAHESLLGSSFQRKPPPHYSSHLNKEEKYVAGIKQFKEMKICNQEFQASQSSTNDGKQDHLHQKDKYYDRDPCENNVNSRRRYPKTKMIPAIDASAYDKMNSHGKNIDTRLDDEVSFTSECFPVELQDIVFLVPEHFPKRSFSESSQFTGSRASHDEQLAEEIGNNRLSACFSPQELYSGEFSAGIPHSFLLPSDAAVHTKSAMQSHNLVTSQTIDEDTACLDMKSVTTISPEGKCSAVHEKITRRSFSVEVSKKTQADIFEKPTVKGMHPSPARRFSFSLGRMTRSFSFKESSASPQLSSACSVSNSCPVRPEVSSAMDNFDKDKSSSSTRGRSSPLRRLLDPLLKHKVAQSETVRPPNESPHSAASRAMATKGPYQDRKPSASNFQALFQLTMKNGLPSFKLVVDNSSDMLVAVMKRLPSSGKIGSCMIYAFYSVREIRKKGMNWMSQGSKSKSCGLVYNIVGQMKISSSYLAKTNAEDSGQCVVREYVLYGVDLGQVDKQTPEFLPKKEIAAIVVKNPSEEFNVNSNSTVVILPGGVHGIPIKGAQSSLISRWRSCGSCDCGGWDIGCKLRVLTNHHNSSKILKPSIPDSAVNGINLFFQEGQHKSKPVFSLEPFTNGIYSIELDTSISLLEAFATCVASVTCQKFSTILDANYLSDMEYFPEINLGTEKMKTPTTIQGTVPPKYVAYPPLSPIGRV